MGNRIIYNHGYNRIGDKDWKLRAGELTSDKNHPIAYVFISKSELAEITIVVGEGITRKDHMPNDRIVSGDGDKYVNQRLLIDLKNKKCGGVRSTLERMFKAAHREMKRQGGTEFSEVFDIEKLRSYTDSNLLLRASYCAIPVYPSYCGIPVRRLPCMFGIDSRWPG